MLFTKIRNVKSPSRANMTDAGIDFFVPAFDADLAIVVNEKSMKVDTITDKEILIAPGDNIMIPLGIKVIVDSGTALVAFNKSGVASKKGLLVGACVTGDTEIKCNVNGEDMVICAKDFTEDFIAGEDVKVYSKNTTTGAIELNYTDKGFRKTRDAECVELTMDDGTILRCSDDHRLLTKNHGYVMAKDLEECHEL